MSARDTRSSDVGRIYDALPGGKDNFAGAREAARRRTISICDIVTAPRAGDGIARFSGGPEIVPAGLCDVASWRVGPWRGQSGRVLFPGGAGRKQ